MLGRDRLDPKAADYSAILTKIKSLNPEALYFGGVAQAGIKLAKQAYDIIPKVIKGGPDGMYGADLPQPAPASRRSEGWYATIAAPHLTDDTQGRASSSPPSRAGSAWRRTTTRSPPTTRRW